MANGRAAAVEAHDALASEPFLAVGEIAGRAASARILLAAPLSLAEIERIAGGSIETTDELTFDRASASLRARRRRRLGAVVLAEQALAVTQDEEAAQALARGVLSLGVARLPWTAAVRQWRDRVVFLRRAEGERVAGPVGRSACRRPRLAGPVPRRQDAARRDRRRRSRPSARRASCRGIWRAASTTRRRRISARRPGRRRQSPTKPKAARRLRCACRSCSGSRSIRRWPAGAFRSRSSFFRPPIARSRSRATCRASGAAPGPLSAPTSAAAIPAISGPRTPAPPRRPRGRNREGREGEGVWSGRSAGGTLVQPERFRGRVGDFSAPIVRRTGGSRLLRTKSRRWQSLRNRVIDAVRTRR